MVVNLVVHEKVGNICAEMLSVMFQADHLRFAGGSID